MGKKDVVLERELRRDRRRYLAKVAALAASTVLVGFSMYASFNKRPVPRMGVEGRDSPAVTPRVPELVHVRDRPLEDILGSYGKVTLVQGNGDDLYLIGQEHYNRVITSNGPEYKGHDEHQAGNLPKVQSEIFNILMALHKERNLRLFVGEGLGPNELGVNSGLRADFEALGRDPLAYFSKRKAEVGYALAKDVLGDAVILAGVDDRKEMAELGMLDKRSFEVDSRYLQNRLGPDELIEWRKVSDEIAVRKDKLNDERSRIYLRQGLGLAGTYYQRSLAIIIGSAHLPLMVKEHNALLEAGNTRYRLVVIRPNSCSK